MAIAQLASDKASAPQYLEVLCSRRNVGKAKIEKPKSFKTRGAAAAHSFATSFFSVASTKLFRSDPLIAFLSRLIIDPPTGEQEPQWTRCVVGSSSRQDRKHHWNQSMNTKGDGVAIHIPSL
uniref:hypothetical protein n=1 Tax=Cupriavidus taiwanensis TaxID=164546 RepID=UPI0011C023A8|nr:hypothetical protein [Cupriavidus taiwanensis]